MKKTEMKKELDEITLSPISQKERAISKTRYKPFARYSFWVLTKYADNEEIFHVNDLVHYAKINYNSAYMFFKNLCNLGYAKETSTTQSIQFELTTNDGHIKLMDLLPYIKKTLKNG